MTSKIFSQLPSSAGEAYFNTNTEKNEGMLANDGVTLSRSSSNYSLNGQIEEDEEDKKVVSSGWTDRSNRQENPAGLVTEDNNNEINSLATNATSPQDPQIIIDKLIREKIELDSLVNEKILQLSELQLQNSKLWKLVKRQHLTILDLQKDLDEAVERNERLRSHTLSPIKHARSVTASASTSTIASQSLPEQGGIATTGAAPKIKSLRASLLPAQDDQTSMVSTSSLSASNSSHSLDGSSETELNSVARSVVYSPIQKASKVRVERSRSGSSEKVEKIENEQSSQSGLLTLGPPFGSPLGIRLEPPVESPSLVEPLRAHPGESLERQFKSPLGPPVSLSPFNAAAQSSPLHASHLETHDPLLSESSSKTTSNHSSDSSDYSSISEKDASLLLPLRSESRPHPVSIDNDSTATTTPERRVATPTPAVYDTSSTMTPTRSNFLSTENNANSIISGEPSTPTPTLKKRPPPLSFNNNKAPEAVISSASYAVSPLGSNPVPPLSRPVLTPSSVPKYELVSSKITFFSFSRY